MSEFDKLAGEYLLLICGTTAAAWITYLVLWATCRALDGIVFLTGIVLPAFPRAFRVAFVEAFMERRNRKKVKP